MIVISSETILVVRKRGIPSSSFRHAFWSLRLFVFIIYIYASFVEKKTEGA